MQRLCLTCVLVAFCAAAHAEWKPLTDSAFGSMLYDPASVHVENGIAQMQYRIDFAHTRQNAQGKSFSSATMKVAVDCRRQTVSLLEMQTHEGHHGDGALAERYTPPAPAAEKVASNSSSAFVYKAACGAAALPIAQASSTMAAPAASGSSKPAAPVPAAPAKK
jgi:hypothetical protein